MLWTLCCVTTQQIAVPELSPCASLRLMLFFWNVCYMICSEIVHCSRAASIALPWKWGDGDTVQVAGKLSGRREDKSVIHSASL